MNSLLLLSLHDVSPVHLAQLKRAEALFRELGVYKVTYLFIPNFMGRYPSTEHPEFQAWCRSRRDFKVHWGLHGFFHQERSLVANTKILGRWKDALKRQLQLAGESEFRTLDSETQVQRLDAGLEIFRRCLGIKPAGFVPPAWLHTSELLPLLAERGIPFTENRNHLLRTSDGQKLACDLISWSSHSALRRTLSIASAHVQFFRKRRNPILRLALHPQDFDHFESEDSIRTLVKTALKNRILATWSDIDFSNSP
jgi:predicted deacetylase